MNTNNSKMERIARFDDLIRRQTGRAVRPYRADGYINLLNRYGTSKDTSEQYQFAAEPTVPDEILAQAYEGNGLFARIIDTPAEEAVKYGFSLKGVSDQAIEDFYTSALDELDWEETAMTAIKWARLFGGAIVVMLVNDGRGIDEPLDWKRIKSIDDLRVYDRSVIQPDYNSIFSYDPRDPFGSRGSRLGLPEYYYISSRYGTFTVHESRCLVFQNGILPESCTSSVYQLWGVPEYIRIHRAMRDAEVAHGSAVKMLDRSVQPVYKMRDLSSELATEEGESRLLKRLQTIDMARGLMNSITVDSEGEDYDFKTFQLSGVSSVVDTTCNYLSALTAIPQTILFGRSPAGMDATGESDMENYYNYVERIQKRMLRSNLRYLLSVIFQAGVSTGEVDKVPHIDVEFKPLWSLSEVEEADLALKKAQTQQIKAAVASTYIQNQVLDPTEVRKKLADSSEFDIETILDDEDLDDEHNLAEAMEETAADDDPSTAAAGFVKAGEETGNAPAAAPEATKLPQDMSSNSTITSTNEEPESNKQPIFSEVKDLTKQSTASHEKRDKNTDNALPGAVGILVVKDGKILTGTRLHDNGNGLLCGPGGHIEPGETSVMAAVRETSEEFGIIPKELIPLGKGTPEPESGLTPDLYLCTDYDGTPVVDAIEMLNPHFLSLEELEQLKPSLFAPFADSLTVLTDVLNEGKTTERTDGQFIATTTDKLQKALSATQTLQSRVRDYQTFHSTKHENHGIINISKGKQNGSECEETDPLTLSDGRNDSIVSNEDGGPGSGNFGHGAEGPGNKAAAVLTQKALHTQFPAASLQLLISSVKATPCRRRMM